MNDHDFGDDLRDALRPDDGIRPLDPAAVIAGAHRRRRMRGLAAAGLASVAVLAIAAGGLLASGSPAGTAPAPAGPPTAGTSGVLPTPPRPPGSPTPPFDLPNATPSGQITAGRTVGRNTPSHGTDSPDSPSSPNPDSRSTPNPARIASFLSRCREALVAEESGPGPSSTTRASWAGADATTAIVADGNTWGACDNGYDGSEITLRKPASLQRPSRSDLQALAVANNVLTRGGQQYEYYWGAGVLPQGVAGLRYTFPDGAAEEAVVSGTFWLMRHRSAKPGGNQQGGPLIKVDLLGASGAVLVTRELQWGLHTCAQISHGC